MRCQRQIDASTIGKRRYLQVVDRVCTIRLHRNDGSSDHRIDHCSSVSHANSHGSQLASVESRSWGFNSERRRRVLPSVSRIHDQLISCSLVSTTAAVQP